MFDGMQRDDARQEQSDKDRDDIRAHTRAAYDAALKHTVGTGWAFADPVTSAREIEDVAEKERIGRNAIDGLGPEMCAAIIPLLGDVPDSGRIVAYGTNGQHAFRVRIRRPPLGTLPVHFVVSPQDVDALRAVIDGLRAYPKQEAKWKKSMPWVWRHAQRTAARNWR